jgi:hypothetical protein
MVLHRIEKLSDYAALLRKNRFRKTRAAWLLEIAQRFCGILRFDLKRMADGKDMPSAILCKAGFL